MTKSKTVGLSNQNTSAKPDRKGDESSPAISGLPNVYSLVHVLDKLNIAVILTDIDARVLFMNRGAKDIVKFKTGLFVFHRALRAGTESETGKLRELIRRAALNAEDPIGQSRYLGMAVGEGEVAGPQSIVIVGLGSNGFDERPREGHAVLFIALRGRSQRIPCDILREIFGLTPSEATLASHLIDGSGLGPAAKKSSIGTNTARTHLKKIFAKTQTGRQAELVRVLLRSVGIVRFD